MSDYIDREAVLNLARSGQLIANSNFRKVCKLIEDITAADVRPVWIPVAERLPEENEEVLVVAVNDFNRNDRWTAIDWLYCGEWQQHTIVTHWMPLPEPPKGGES